MAQDGNSMNFSWAGVLNLLTATGKRIPDTILQAFAVAFILSSIVFPMKFASKQEADANHSIAFKALCLGYGNRSSVQESATQNELYNLEGQLYSIERTIQTGKPIDRDYIRRDQLRIQIQQLNAKLKSLQRHEVHKGCPNDN